MIDMLVLRCDFTDGFAKLTSHVGFSAIENFLDNIGVTCTATIDPRTKEITACRHPWDSIPSSEESMAFKVFDNRSNELNTFYIEIKCSPAKIMQGQNIFGSDDIYDCSMALISLLLNAYPHFKDLLDWDSWALAQIDITYSSRADNVKNAREFVNCLHHIKYGQLKVKPTGNNYSGTAIFGSRGGRLKQIKVYTKWDEFLNQLGEKRKDFLKRKNHFDFSFDEFDEFNRRGQGSDSWALFTCDALNRIAKSVHTQFLLDYSAGLIRWEVSLYHRWLDRHGVSCKLTDIFKNNTLAPEYLQSYWRLATADLFKALAGQEMKTLNDPEVKQQLRDKYTKISEKTGKFSTVLADSCFRTYQDIRAKGYFVAGESMSRMNFSRHVKMLAECGFSRAALQNMTGMNDGSTIIPFVRFIGVDFGKQLPDDYELPKPVYVYDENNPFKQNKPKQEPTQLRLVA